MKKDQVVLFAIWKIKRKAGWCKAFEQSKQNTLLKSSIGIRHEDSYPYRDIWIIANQDTFHLYLADSTGKWKGKGLGNLRQIVFPVNLNLQEQDSTIKIKINHIMQENPLPGIHDIGMHIEKIQTNE